MNHEKATYEDFCIWLKCVSDAEPSRRRFSTYSAADRETMKSEADRIRRIEAEYKVSRAKAVAAAARVK